MPKENNHVIILQQEKCKILWFIRIKLITKKIMRKIKWKTDALKVNKFMIDYHHSDKFIR